MSNIFERLVTKGDNEELDEMSNSNEYCNDKIDRNTITENASIY